MTTSVKTPEWVKDAIFYQIFPDRFAKSDRVIKPSNLEPWHTPPTPGGFKGGDLVGVMEHLDYLENLGITAIYFNPIFQSASNHRYHTHDYYQIDPLLGGNDAFKSLLEAAHARGMRVVLDGVFNHASRGFFQFNHILECGEQSPYIDWFTVKGFPLHAYNYDEKPNYAAWVGLHALPEFNTANPQVREYIFDIATYWINFGIDGWRLDVPYEIDDDAFWQEFRRRVKSLNPEAYIVGEIWHEAERWLQGDQFDAVMNYIHTRACIAFFGARTLSSLWPGGGYQQLKPIDAPEFATAIERSLKLYNWEVISAQMNLLSSHDTPRFVTLVDGDKQALNLAMLFQLTMPGAPTIYYGDEIGLEGGYEPASRGAFPWDQSAWDTDVLEFVRSTIRLRKAYPALRRGTYQTLLAAGDQYAFERSYQGQRLVMAFNTSSDESTLNVQLEQGTNRVTVIFGSPLDVLLNGTTLAVKAAPRSGTVILLEN